ncbi:MAG: hypothetical protein K2L81_04415, partial [Muribaculaceae bacterium]|nr:hypothetical protein [Muribaculaceae bacterium]
MIGLHKPLNVSATLTMLLIAAWCALTTACSSGQVVVEPNLPVNGIDISSHNGKIDFEAVRADSIDFVIIKATEGSTFKDPAFHTNHTNALKAGLKVGAYHFFRFETNGQQQALNLIKA